MASIGIMAAGVAHEINNPLAFAMGNIEVLERYTHAMTNLLKAYEATVKLIFSGGKDNLEKQIQELHRLRDEEDIDYILSDISALISQSTHGLSRIKTIVSALRNFSRQEESKPTSVQVNEEVHSALVLVENQLKTRCQVKLELGVCAPIVGFPGQLCQVFVNLLTNAGQAMPEKGGAIRITTSQEGDQIVVKIADTGNGVPEEHLKKLFTPFFTTKPVGVGTGLGLAISHGIIQNHGGKIVVESTLGVGTTFTITLPMSGVEIRTA